MQNPPAEIVTYIPDLRRYAMALLRNPIDAEDLVQECLCRAIARARPWRTIRDVRAYLFTILHNLFVDRVVKRVHGQDSVSDDVIERRMVVKPAQMGRLEIRDLSWALDQLSAEQREVILLIGLEGMSYEAAARILGVPNGTVMSRLSRGREHLRRLMDGGEADTAKLEKSNGRQLSKRRAGERLRSRG